MSGSGKTATTTQQISIPPEVMARYRAVNARAENTANTPFMKYSDDPSAFVAPMNDVQMAGVNTIGGAQNTAMPFYGVGTGLSLSGAQGVDRLNSGDINEYLSPFLNNVAASTLGNLSQEQAIQRRDQLGSAAGRGAFGGDRLGLERAELARQQGLAFGNTAANIFNTGYGQAVQTATGQQSVEAQNRARELAAGQQIAGLGSSLTGTQLQAGQALLGAGTVGQQTDQAGLSALYNQFQQERGYPFQVAQFLANIAMGTGALSGSTTTTTQPAPFFSDERLKSDIEQVGELFDGQPIYRYEMGDGRKQIGLLAQDVEESAPEAVGLAGGYKTVDYGRATERAARYQPRHREGLAAGGSANFDQDMIAQILKNQSGMYAGLYGQPGTPRGATGAPGGSSYVPQATLPVGRLATPNSAPQQQASGLSQAASTGKNIAELLQLANAGKNKITSMMGSREAPAVGEPMMLGSAPSAAMPASPPMPPPRPAGIGATAALEEPKEIGTLAELEDAISFAARGGRITRAFGGEVVDDDTTAPLGLYQSNGPGLNIPDVKSEAKLPTPGTLPKTPDSGLSDILGAAKTVASLFLLKSGGRVMRAEGGLVDEEEDKIFPRMITQESRGRQFDKRGAPLTSPKGALGIAQVMPTTGPEAAKLAGEEFDLDRLKNDEEYNRRLGEAYYKEQKRTFGDPIIAAAAYNAGPGRVREALARSKTEGGNYLSYLPAETRDYVSKVSGAGIQAINAAAREAVAQKAPEAGIAGPVGRTPGLAGPGRGPQDPASAPFTHLTQGLFDGMEEGKKAALTSENFWVPIVTGLGTMLASRSPYLGNAIGEGLVGGAQAYQGVQKMQQELGESRANTEGKLADIASTSWRYDGGRLMLRAVKPDGTYFWVPFNEWWAMDEKSRPAIDPRAQEYVRSLTAGKGPGAAGPATAPAPAPDARPAPEAPPAAAPVQKPAAAPSEPVPPIPPSGVTPARQSASMFALTPAQRAEAEKLVKIKSGMSADALAKEPDYFTVQDQLARNIEEQKQLVLPLSGTLASLPREGSIFTSGKFQEIANPVMGILNNIAAIAGKPDLISDPSQLAKQEEVRKLVNQLQQAATNDTQLRAVAAFRDMAEGIPGIMTSPGGQAKLIAQILTNAQRVADKNSFFNEWTRAVSGDRGQNYEWAKATSREANREFDAVYTNAFYNAERQKLESMFNDRVKVDGKEVPVLYVLSMRPELINAKRRAQMEKEYGRGILRYFGIN